MDLKGKTIGYGLTGSHCTLEEIIPQMQRLVDAGANVIPFISYTLLDTDTRFGKASDWQKAFKEVTGNEVIKSVVEAEPFGPQKILDLMVIAPLTGSSTAKLANAINDTPVLMAAKTQMRNQRPLVLAISTNDGLGLNLANVARLMVMKHVYFVPFGQDAPEQKPNSLVARMDLIKETCEAAMEGRQLQPMLVERFRYLN